MEYRVLGNLEVRRDAEVVPIPSFKQRALLALLLMHANEVVSTDRVIDELWGDGELSDPRNALWVHVSNLRTALEPDREKRSEGAVLRTQPPGYLVAVEPGELDSVRFEELVAEGRRLIDDDPPAASMVIGAALALWRGHAYEDVTYEAFAQPEIARLEELRLEAVELRIDADLRRGLAGELVGELESLVRQHQLREGLTASLMLVLYRTGRVADALRAYQRLRAPLADELGLDPSAALQRLEGRILAGDPALDGPEGGLDRPGRFAIRGYELREQVGNDLAGTSYRAYQPSVGREVTVKVVRADVADDPDFIRQFDAAAERVARLHHPHLVQLYDYWREPHGAYLVLQPAGSATLADDVEQATWSPHDVARMAAGVGAGLDLAHRHGVVHGAVTPTSIRIDDQGEARLADFDIAGISTSEVADSSVVDFRAPEQRDEAVPTSGSDQYGLAAVLRYALTGRTPASPAVGPDVPPALAAVLDRATATDPAARFASISSFVKAVAQAAGVAPAATASTLANPYKGLRAFDVADAADFFGRERVIERLLARLGDPAHGRFVVLVGPSGSGKSSTVRAGLVPALRAGALAGSEEWFEVTVTPGRHPFEELEAALLRVAVNPPPTLLEQLTDGDAGMRRAVARVLPDERAQLLLVIDQFEELFTQVEEAQCKAFLNALAAAVTDRHSHVRVVATLRADFYDRPLGNRAIGELVRRGTEVITPMSPAELERAIDGPAERLGIRFAPGLVAEIVADVADQEGALPLLQYALTELFDRRSGPVIELAAYNEIGGVAGALVQRAEATYGDFDQAEREATRQVMLRLVEPGEGTRDVRRRVPRRHLTALGDPAVDRVIDALGRHLMLRFDRDPVTREPTVEVAHEALITTWDRYRTWVEESRDDLRQERRLAVAASEWAAAGNDPSYLLDGPQLDQLSAWAATTDLTLGRRDQDFLQASLIRRDEALVSEEAHVDREVRLRRQARRRFRLLTVGAAVLAVVIGLGLFAVSQRNDADRAASQLAASDDARRLAAAATSYANDDPPLAMLLALESLDTSRRGAIPAATEAEEALHWALQSARIPYPATDAPVQVRIGPKGPTGIFALPLADLVDLARNHVGRSFTAAECTQFAISPCPSRDAGLAGPALTDVAPELPRPPVATSAPASGSQPLAGTRITVVGPLASTGGLQAEIDRFEERTGIEVAYQSANEFDTVVRDATVSRKPPDLAFVPQPGAVVDYARLGELVDLGAYVDGDEARRQFGDYLIDQTAFGSGLYGIPVNLDLKGLVWYPVPEFAEAGYSVPRSWDELVALTRQMVADGRTPWCMGFGSGEASGWPGTDWIEGLVLRTGGVDLYDRWVKHEVRFDDPAIRQAFTMLGDLVFGPGSIRGGSALISQSNVLESHLPMLSDPPGCWLHYQGSLLANFLPAGARAGVDVSYFALPPLEPGGDARLFGGGTTAVAFADRPEVRELITAIADPTWGSDWAADPASQFLPANTDFDPSHCRNDAADEANARFRVGICQQVRELVAAGRWRFDASDLMPPIVGSVDNGHPGAFLQGMLDYVDDGPESLRAVLTAIEVAWQMV